MSGAGTTLKVPTDCTWTVCWLQAEEMLNWGSSWAAWPGRRSWVRSTDAAKTRAR